MARKKSEVERVAVSYTVLPSTKEALRTAADAVKISAGEVLDRAVALYRGGASTSKNEVAVNEEPSRRDLLVLAVMDAGRRAGLCEGGEKLDWTQLVQLCGDLAEAVETVREGELEPVEGWPTSPWAGGRLRHYMATIAKDKTAMQMLDAVVEFFDDILDPKPKDVLVTSSVIPSTLPHKETGPERDARERRARAEAADSVSDPSIDRSDEFVGL